MHSDGPGERVGVLPRVQVLRGVAALMVAYLHLCVVSDFPERLWPPNWPVDVFVMAAGVDVFFAISGFIMLVTSRRLAPGEFLLRRVVRVVPLYWFYTLLFAIVATVRPGQLESAVVNAETLFKSLAFIPYENPGRPGYITPLLQLGWTLNYEMLFYAIFAGALLLPLRHRALATTAVFAALMSLRLLPITEHSAALTFWSDPILLEFTFGMLIGHLFLSGPALPTWVCRALIALGFALLLGGVTAIDESAWRFASWGVPCALAVLGAVMLDRQRGLGRLWRLPLLLGDASYSI